jgi:L-arabinokinase
MKRLACYISGHGFGHASRVLEVLNALRARWPAIGVDIRSPVPRWFFEFNATFPFTYAPSRLDVGAVQRDSLSLDPEATLRAYAAIAARGPEIVSTELRALAPEPPALVLADIPALAIEVARRLGVPAVAMTNFSWDWIYADYVRDLPAYEYLVDELRACYASTSLLLRLPLHGDLGVFPRIRDIPFVARRARLSPEDVRRRLALPEAAPVVLLSYGGLGVALRHSPVIPAGATLVTSQPLFEGIETPWCRTIPADAMRAAGVRYEDLLAAADVVMTKPGYGIVAECIANSTPMIYTPRGRFAEYDCLVPGIAAHLPHAVLDDEALYAGRWRETLEMVLALPRRRTTADIDGAAVAASALASMLDEA